MFIGNPGIVQGAGQGSSLLFDLLQFTFGALQFCLAGAALLVQPAQVAEVLLKQFAVLDQLRQGILFLFLLLFQLLHLLQLFTGLVQLPTGVIPGLFLFGTIKLPGQLPEAIHLPLILFNPQLQVVDLLLQIFPLFIQFFVVTLGLAGGRQQHVALAFYFLDDCIAAGAGHLAYQGIEGGFQVIAGVFNGLFDILTGALLYPKQARNTPMLRLAGTPLGVLVAQQFRQLFFCIVFTPGFITDRQVTAGAFQKTFDQAPLGPLMLEGQFNGGSCRRITPRAQVVYRLGPVTLEKRRPDGPHQGTFAGFVGAVNQVQARLEIIQDKGLAELAQLFNFQALEFHWPASGAGVFSNEARMARASRAA